MGRHENDHQAHQHVVVSDRDNRRLLYLLTCGTQTGRLSPLLHQSPPSTSKEGASP
jgi:hypothetical protein